MFSIRGSCVIPGKGRTQEDGGSQVVPLRALFYVHNNVFSMWGMSALYLFCVVLLKNWA